MAVARRRMDSWCANSMGLLRRLLSPYFELVALSQDMLHSIPAAAEYHKTELRIAKLCGAILPPALPTASTRFLALCRLAHQMRARALSPSAALRPMRFYSKTARPRRCTPHSSRKHELGTGQSQTHEGGHTIWVDSGACTVCSVQAIQGGPTKLPSGHFTDHCTLAWPLHSASF